MKTFIALAVLLSFSSAAFAADPAPSCVEDKIAVQKLTQQNAALLQQLMQAQFQASQTAAEAAKAEQTRLETLLPKKPEEQSAPPAPPNTTTVSPQPPDTTAE